MSAKIAWAIATVVVGSALAAHAQAQDLHPAMNKPDEFAWKLFFDINHPAVPGQRGVKDTAKKLGDPGPTVWETWKLARTEVFLPFGCTPGSWGAPPPALANVAAVPASIMTKGASQFAAAATPAQFKVFDPPKFSDDFASAVGVDVDPGGELAPANLGLAQAFSPTAPELVVDAGEIGNETRMNKEMFDFIVENELYRIDGQEQLLRDNVGIDFPVQAKEIKAAWRMFTDKELDPEQNQRDLNGNGKIEDDERGLNLLNRIYHVGYGVVENEQTGQLEPRPFGLAGIHIITKDIPNWFWTTFEHVDNPQASINALDRYSPPDKGYPPEAEGTVWQYYRLRGTQVDFVTPTGRPTILGNTQIEGSFQETSSCITCHAGATIGRRLDDINDSAGRPIFPLGSFVPPSGSVGRPPAANAAYRFGANRLTVFEDFRVARPYPDLPTADPKNRGRLVSLLKGAVGSPDPKLFVATGTSNQQYAQLDFVWALRRAFRSEPDKCGLQR